MDEIENGLMRFGWLALRVGIKTKLAHWFGWKQFNLSLSARDVELLCALRRDAALRPDGVYAALFRERPNVLEWINKNVAGRA